MEMMPKSFFVSLSRMLLYFKSLLSHHASHTSFVEGRERNVNYYVV